MQLQLQNSKINSSTDLTITGSKSESNRLLFLKALFSSLEVQNVSNSDDSQYMLKALSTESTTVDIHHAGTAMRFLTAYFSIQEGREVTLTGSKRMKERPIQILVEALQELGSDIAYLENTGFPPIKIKGKKQSLKTLNVKGRDFKIENFYEGIARFDFNELCDQNLGAEDYLEIIKNCKFIVINQVPQFSDTNSNQQQRFITLLDVIYDKNISIAVTANQNLDQFTSSRLLEKPFKRTISRLYELTSKENNL